MTNRATCCDRFGEIPGNPGHLRASEEGGESWETAEMEAMAWVGLGGLTEPKGGGPCLRDSCAVRGAKFWDGTEQWQ